MFPKDNSIRDRGQGVLMPPILFYPIKQYYFLTFKKFCATISLEILEGV